MELPKAHIRPAAGLGIRLALGPVSRRDGEKAGAQPSAAINQWSAGRQPHHVAWLEGMDDTIDLDLIRVFNGVADHHLVVPKRERDFAILEVDDTACNPCAGFVVMRTFVDAPPGLNGNGFSSAYL